MKRRRNVDLYVVGSLEESLKSRTAFPRTSGITDPNSLVIGQEIDLTAPPPSRADTPVLIREGTARCNEVLGKMILAAKEQWVWFHQRWCDS